MPNKYHRFPLFIDMSGKKVLIVGGGKIAKRRINTLLSYGADITVVTLSACEEIEAFAAEGKISLNLQGFEKENLDGKFMVLAATDNPSLNTEICAQARAKGAIANNASVKADCDFFFPAVISNDELSIGLCGTGDDHKAVAKAAAEIRQRFK